MSEQASRTTTHLEDLSRQQSAAFADKHATLVERIDGEHDHFSELCSFIQEKAASELTAAVANFANQTADLKRAVQDDSAASAERVDAHQKHFTELCAKLDERLTVEYEEMNNRFTERYSMLDGNFETLNTTVHQHHKQFTEACIRLDKKFTEKNADQDELAQQRHSQLSTQCSAVEKHVVEELGRIGERMEDYHKHATSAYSSLDARFSDASADLDSKFSDSCSRLEQKLAQKDLEHQHRTKQHSEHLSDMCASLDHKFTELHAELDEKFTEKCVDQDSRMDGLSSTIGEHHAHFTSMCAQLNRTHTQKESAQDELIEDHRQYFSTVFTKLERRMAEDTASLDHRMMEKTSAQDERLDEITNTVEEHHDHFTTVCAQLDRRFTETHELQEARVKEVHQHFTVLDSRQWMST